MNAGQKLQTWSSTTVNPESIIRYGGSASHSTTPPKTRPKRVNLNAHRRGGFHLGGIIYSSTGYANMTTKNMIVKEDI